MQVMGIEEATLTTTIITAQAYHRMQVTATDMKENTLVTTTTIDQLIAMDKKEATLETITTTAHQALTITTLLVMLMVTKDLTLLEEEPITPHLTDPPILLLTDTFKHSKTTLEKCYTTKSSFT